MYEKKVKPTEKSSETNSTLKNRNNEEKTKEESTKVENEVKFRNPLYWYGVLVPQSLRSSQKDFKNGN